MTESSKEGVDSDTKDTIDRKLDELNVSKTEAGKDQKQKPDTEGSTSSSKNLDEESDPVPDITTRGMRACLSARLSSICHCEWLISGAIAAWFTIATSAIPPIKLPNSVGTRKTLK
jgi:hypothetical protein